MSVFHDEVEIEDFEYDEDSETYYYPCPCGDRFAITKEELENGEDVATCPSCSLIVRVIYDLVSINYTILWHHLRFTITDLCNITVISVALLAKLLGARRKHNAFLPAPKEQ